MDPQEQFLEEVSREVSLMSEKTEDMIQYISESKKKTHVKIYINGEDLPLSYKDLKIFGTCESCVVFGDYSQAQKYLKDNHKNIKEFHIEVIDRNSAIEMLDVKDIDARIEPGAYIREHVHIGKQAVIMMGAIINIGAFIGDQTMIDMGVVVGGRAHIGSHCHIGAGAVIAGVIEPPSAQPVVIEDGVLIGANAVVVEGVHIGKDAVIGAGTIVLEDVPAQSVVVGNPGKIMKRSIDKVTAQKTRRIDALRKL